MANRWGESRNSDIFYFLLLQNHCRQWLQLWNQKTLAPWKKSYDKPRHCIKKQRYQFAKKGLSSQRYDFSSSRVEMWELDHKEGWELKNWCLWTVVLKKTLESPLDCKEIKPINPKGNQTWIFIRRADQIRSYQSLSGVQLFATPWTAEHQASLSITNFRSLLKLMSIESVMPSGDLILCHPLLLLPSIFPSIRIFSNESVLHIG